jgi:hypothetical protein
LNLVRRNKAVSGIAALALFSFLAGTMILGTQATTFSSGAAYNSVQVFITTQSSLNTSYLVSAYNSTGGLVATSQSQYPAVSFELPSGNYLFTVVASQPYSNKNPIPLGIAQSSSAIAYPISNSPSEYGYSMVLVSSSSTINISTTAISDLKTTHVTVHVNYQNGTVASDASVGASIIGGWYWIYENNVVLSNQTDNNGVATLTVPMVPVEVTAWKWVPVNLPDNETTMQVNVGGELVNVTVYWQPTYVGLAGEALIIPPEASASITLHSQQSSYWVMPYGVETPQSQIGTSSSAQIANSPGGIPANQYSALSNGTPSGSPSLTQTISNQIPPLPSITTTTATTTVGSSKSGMLSVLEISIIVTAIMAISAIALAVRKK